MVDKVSQEFTCKCKQRKGWIIDGEITECCPVCNRRYIGKYNQINLCIDAIEIGEVESKPTFNIKKKLTELITNWKNWQEKTLSGDAKAIVGDLIELREDVDTQIITIDDINKKIDEMLEECRKRRMPLVIKCDFNTPEYLCEVGYKDALVELKQFLKGDLNENTN